MRRENGGDGNIKLDIVLREFYRHSRFKRKTLHSGGKTAGDGGYLEVENKQKAEIYKVGKTKPKRSKPLLYYRIINFGDW